MFQIADVDSGVILWLNGDLLTHVLPAEVEGLTPHRSLAVRRAAVDQGHDSVPRGKSRSPFLGLDRTAPATKRCERTEGLEADCGATLNKCSIDAVAKMPKQARARNKVLQFRQLMPSYVHDRESPANFS
jgi:hypothetical protein